MAGSGATTGDAVAGWRSGRLHQTSIHTSPPTTLPGKRTRRAHSVSCAGYTPCCTQRILITAFETACGGGELENGTAQTRTAHAVGSPGGD